MVLVSYSGKEINAKLVYYGPGLSGKTTNLEYIYGSIPQTHRGKMVSMKTKTERTLFFDFLPVNLGELAGFKTRFLLYTVPGQVYYNATRKLVLKGVDAVVFVADSKRGKMDENVESLENLKENLREHGLSLDSIPWVIQYNKRDLAEVYTIDELQQVLNPAGAPYYEAVATNGDGVVDTFKAVSKLLLRKLSKEVGVPVLGQRPAVEAAPQESAPPVAPAAPAAAPSLEPRVETPVGHTSPVPTAAPAPSIGIVRGPQSFEVQSPPQAPPQQSGLEAAASLSVGDRLRRWLGRKDSAPESSYTLPVEAVEQAAPAAPVAVSLPEPSTMPVAPAPHEPPVPLRAGGTISEALSIAPPSPAREPRTILLPLDLSPEDLSTGVILQLSIKIRSEESERREAA